MRCPKCDQLPSPVLKTERPVEFDNVKRRRRRCRNCRKDFYTYEVSEDEFKKLHPNIITPATEKVERSPLKTKAKKED